MIIYIAPKWTQDSEIALKNQNETGDSLEDFVEKQNSELMDIIIMVRGKLSKMSRYTINALITISLHNKEVTENLVKDNITSLFDFEWLKQLR
jgi:dynein heavy chain